jgi:hypothetical protein
MWSAYRRPAACGARHFSDSHLPLALFITASRHTAYRLVPYTLSATLSRTGVVLRSARGMDLSIGMRVDISTLDCSGSSSVAKGWGLVCPRARQAQCLYMLRYRGVLFCSIHNTVSRCPPIRGVLLSGLFFCALTILPALHATERSRTRVSCVARA